jgi:hypothetical protein
MPHAPSSNEIPFRIPSFCRKPDLYIGRNGEIACSKHALGDLQDWQRMTSIEVEWMAREAGRCACEICSARSR